MRYYTSANTKVSKQLKLNWWKEEEGLHSLFRRGSSELRYAPENGNSRALKMDDRRDKGPCRRVGAKLMSRASSME